MSTVPSVEEKLKLRLRLVADIASGLGTQLDRPLSGQMASEIAVQRGVGGWERSATPLETGWYSTLQHTSAAIGHARALTGWAAAPDHFASGALLARGALESLSVVAWLLDPSEAVQVRSPRALAEVKDSTDQLKKLYRDQGVTMDGVEDGAEAIAVDEALAQIVRDGLRVAGEGTKVPERPPFLELIEGLFGRR